MTYLLPPDLDLAAACTYTTAVVSSAHDMIGLTFFLMFYQVSHYVLVVPNPLAAVQMWGEVTAYEFVVHLKLSQCHAPVHAPFSLDGEGSQLSTARAGSMLFRPSPFFCFFGTASPGPLRFSLYPEFCPACCSIFVLLFLA